MVHNKYEFSTPKYFHQAAPDLSSRIGEVSIDDNLLAYQYVGVLLLEIIKKENENLSALRYVYLIV